MEELRSSLQQIEASLDSGSYQPGPWAAFLREAARRPMPERAALADDISRVSNKLHQRHGRKTFPLLPALLLEAAATVAGGWLLRIGLKRRSPLTTAAATLLWLFTFQPLIKVAAGSLLGIRYAYSYAQGLEPKFKMRYGSYLAAPRWKRTLTQAAGMVGAPLALWLVSSLTRLHMPRTSAVCKGLCWFMAATQLIAFLAGLAGVRRFGKVELVRAMSGGAAGGEIRDAFTE